MKTTLALLFGAALSILVGCSSFSSENAGTTLATVAGLAVEPVLANNPSYIPVAQAVAGELDTLSTGTLDTTGVVALAAQIASKHGLSAADAQFAQIILQTLLASYTDQTGALSIDLGKAQPYLKAFASGLKTSVAMASAGAKSGPTEPAAARYTKLYAGGSQ